jgi:hypothetical protein
MKEKHVKKHYKKFQNNYRNIYVHSKKLETYTNKYWCWKNHEWVEYTRSWYPVLLRQQVYCIDEDYSFGIVGCWQDRYIRTHQERRYNDSTRRDEYEDGYKVSGRLRDLPTYWDDIPFARGNRKRCWKKHTKCRKQWMINL